MKPFMTLVTPHKDILEGKLTMDVFAADLWQVHKGKAPEEYKDPDLFFRKTFLTVGLNNLLDVTKKRLQGEGGDPIIQLQTPFGGGKTHALIALYHKAKEWNAKVVVIDGTVFDPKERTLWEEMEFQLKGRVELLGGRTSPGREKLYNLFSENQPVLILIDELLEYITKASGIKVGDTNLASQTFAFIQELTTTVRTLDKTLLILTLPSSILEQYDQNAETILNRIQHITGRVEKVYTPVQDEEVASVIIKRLFSHIDEKGARENIEEFLSYTERENIFPLNMDKSYYRDKFIKSFPFQPEVIDIIYKRWGSFPNFQRTRGVLRILALVVHSLKNSEKPFIRLGDIDLKNEEIRRELIKHIGSEYDSVLASDITLPDSGAKRVDKSLGSTYSPFALGTKCATTIFMYSFSGGPEKGITLQELKLCCAEVHHSSSIVAEVVEKLKETLFYLSDAGLFFTNQPNLNRILLNKLDSVDDRYVEEEEKDILNAYLSKKDSKFDVIIWPNKTRDVPDTKNLKLIILKEYSEEKVKEFIERCGDRPRVNRNTLIFLCPLKNERANFEKFIKDKLAWKLIEQDKTLNLTKEQELEVKNRLKKFEDDAKARLRDFYRIVVIPSKGGLRDIDLGVGVYGSIRTLDEEVYNRLKSEGEIVESINAYVIANKYLNRDYVAIRDILDVFYTSPGEPKILGEEFIKHTIREGVKQGLFGIGRLEEGEPICKHFKEDCQVELSEEEIIIKPGLCESEVVEEYKIYKNQEQASQITSTNILSSAEPTAQTYSTPIKPREEYSSLFLKFPIPFGRMAETSNLINILNRNFRDLKVVIEISAKDGRLSKKDYEDKVEETLKQIGIREEDIDIKLTQDKED